MTLGERLALYCQFPSSSHLELDDVKNAAFICLAAEQLRKAQLARIAAFGDVNTEGPRNNAFEALLSAVGKANA